MSVEFSFGEWLRRKRKALDLTRDELAERLGYSAATIRKIEDEERHPSAQVIERLAEIFNIPPGERKDFLRFARGDWKSAPIDTEEDRPWHASSKSPRSNIPATTTSLIAREKEIALVCEYLSNDNIRLVTLMGPPGIGKTRLSIEVARIARADFPNGVFFVALAPLDDGNLIPSAIAQALGYVGAKDISTSEQIKEGIGSKNLLLVLDNCEHLIEDVSSLASTLLSACSQLKILATSRESLRIAGEWLYPVPAFDVPTDGSSIDLKTISNFPAIKLFSERARAVRPDFVLSDENVETVSAICARLDGLPLVIELIAARLRLMSPETLLERLSTQFVLTADGMRAASERQKTLKHAIHWSYNLLSAEEQKLFACLSVFSGGFTLEAAERIFSDAVMEKQVPDLITLLLDKSLLQRIPDHEPRFTMLVTIQEFARERLREIGDETNIRKLHLSYFLDFSEKGGREMRGSNQLDWFRRFIDTRDNLRAALEWAIETGRTEAALQMTRNLHWFWFVHSDHTEARRWFERVLAISDAPHYAGLYAEVLTQFAHHIWTQIGPADARPLVELALSIARANADKQNTARALAVLGLVLIVEKNFAEAGLMLKESQTLFVETQDKWEYAHTLMCLALGADRQEQLSMSLELHQQALALFREIGDLYFQSFALNFIGILQVKEGNVTQGMAALREALILARRLDSRHGIASAIGRFAAAAQYTGDPRRAVYLYWAAKNIWDSFGTWQKEDEIEFEHWLAPSRAMLSPAEFAEAIEQGHQITLEQAIAYALESNDD
jgi:non-specific serine/threonine protein kinase